MEKSSKQGAKDTEKKSTRSLDKTLRNVMIATVICAVVATIGVGFGVYGTIQANRAIAILEEYENSEDDLYSDLEATYEKPQSVDDIVTVWISYNGSEDYISIENGEMYYYAFDDEGEEISEDLEIDTKEIMQYIFDNDLGYISDTEPDDFEDDVDWSLEIDTEDAYSFIGDKGEAPEWFNKLLEKLDVNTHGYKSKGSNS